MWAQFKTFMGGLLFQLLIGFVAGVVISGYFMIVVHKYQMEEAITLGCFIHNKIVYEVKQRQ